MSKSVAVTVQTPVESPPMRAGSRGGQLRSGNPGNRGGIGAPPSIIREKLRGSFHQRVSVLEAIADGEPMVTTEVSWAQVAAHLKCGECESTNIVPRNPDHVKHITWRAKGSANPNDRNKAIDIMGKYSLASGKALTSEHVRACLEATYRVLGEHLDAATFALIDSHLAKVWR